MTNKKLRCPQMQPLWQFFHPPEGVPQLYVSLTTQQYTTAAFYRKRHWLNLSYLSLLQFEPRLAMLLSETSHLGKQSLLVRGKKRNKWTPCQHRPKRHLLPSKVSESLRNHQSVLFLKGDYCFRIKMERNASTLYPTHLQFNSFMQNSDKGWSLGLKQCRVEERNLFQASLTRSHDNLFAVNSSLLQRNVE